MGQERSDQLQLHYNGIDLYQLQLHFQPITVASAIITQTITKPTITNKLTITLYLIISYSEPLNKLIVVTIQLSIDST